MDVNANLIARTLLGVGYECYFVGGAVRDSLLGKPYHDIDLATNATPEQVTSLFERISTVVPTGLKHGTVTLVFGTKQYEVTTYRRDMVTDGRHAQVEYAQTIAEDLSRRDFTINAMALHLDGTLVDPFNGQGDLLDKVVRTVGPADTRFSEDYLRMLRLLRFSANLGFDIDPSAITAVNRNLDGINRISIERCREELMKMLSGDNVLQALGNLRDTGLLGKIMPEIEPCFGFPQNRHHKHDVFTHMAIACAALPKEKPVLRFTALVHDISKPETCKGKGTPDASFHSHEYVGAKKVTELMTRMKFSSGDTERVSNLVRHHMFQYSSELTDGAVRRLVREVGLENVADLIEVKWSDRVGNGTKVTTPFNPNTALRQHVDRLVAEASAFGMKDLKINGNILMNDLGIKQGPLIGRVLNALLEKVLDNSALNEESKLLELAREIQAGA